MGGEGRRHSGLRLLAYIFVFLLIFVFVFVSIFVFVLGGDTALDAERGASDTVDLACLDVFVFLPIFVFI